MKHRGAIVAAAFSLSGLAFAHGHSGAIDPSMPDAWKYRLCGDMATVAVQALHERDRGRPMPTIRKHPDDGAAATALAEAITRRVFEEPQISSPKKAEAFGRGYCMEQLTK